MENSDINDKKGLKNVIFFYESKELSFIICGQIKILLLKKIGCIGWLITEMHLKPN